MIDQNEAQGRELLRLGLCTQEAVQYAYQAAKPYPHLDLCDCLIQQGKLSPADALVVRRATGTMTPPPNQNPATSRSRANPPTVVDSISHSAVQAPGSSSQGQRDLGPGTSIKRLGDYELLEQIGHGGMGSVFRVQSVSLKTTFALKTMHGGPIGESEALERFMLEAETTARLNHPNIVRIHYVGEDKGVHYLVMDYIEGTTLKYYVSDQETLDEKECARIIAKMANALSYAHSHAILHRDVKPDNVLMRGVDNEPILTDFGLAKDANDERKGLTISGAAIGTPEYMSPEQADGDLELIDRRSDVYSLGATLYYALTERPPLQGTTVTNTLKAVMLNEPDSPKKYHPELSTDLETICLKCLEKDPAQRYPTALALAEDLERFLADESILARPPSLTERLRRWRRRNSTALQITASVILTTLLISGLLGFQEYRADQRNQEIQRDLRSALESTHKALEEAPGTMLEKWNKRLSVLDDDIPKNEGTLDSYQEELETLASSLKAEVLRKRCLEIYEKEWKAATAHLSEDRGELPELKSDRTQSFVSSPAWAEIEAHRQYTLAQIFDKSGEQKKAEFARTRAYQVSPKSQYGNRALLDAAERILEEKRFVVADQLFARILKNKSPYLQGRALYGRARVALWRQQTAKTLRLIERVEELRKVDPRLAQDMSEQKLLWLKQISESFGRAQGAAEIDKKKLVPNLPGQAPLFCDFKNKRQLEIFIGHWREHKIELEPGPRVELPGDYVRQSQWNHQGKALWAIQYRDDKGNRVRFYEWDGRVLKRMNRPIVRLRPAYYLNRICDIDGNGEIDLLVHCPFGAKSPERTQVRVLMNVFTAQRKELVLRETVGSVLYCMRMADFDGDGKSEILVGLGEWSHFRVLVFKLSDDPKGYRLDFEKVLGVVVHVDVRRDAGSQRDEVILTVYRHEEFDIPEIFGDDLSPDLPNGIWRLRQGEDGEYQSTLAASTPFNRQVQVRLYSATFLGGLARDFPGSHVFFAAGRYKRPVFHFVPGPDSKGLPTLLAKAPLEANRHYRFSSHDLDGDGDLELLFGTYLSRHFFYGLKNESVVESSQFIVRGEELNAAKIEEDGIEVALNLLDLGQEKAARRELERYCQSKSISVTQWVMAHKYLSISWAREKNYERAKQVALKAWSAAPRQSFDLVLAAIEYAFQLKDYTEAEQILESVPDFIQLNAEQNKRLRRAKQRVAAVSAVSRIIRVDKKCLQSERFPFSVRKPWFFRWTADGFSIRVQRKASPLLSLPISCSGTPIRIQSAFRVPYVGFGERINFGVEIENSIPSFLHIQMEMRGGGGVSSLQRTVRFMTQYGDAASGTTHKLKAFRRNVDLKLEGFYDLEERGVKSRFQAFRTDKEIQTPTRWRLSSGKGRIFFGYSGTKKLSVGARPGHSLLEMSHFILDANPKKFRILPRAKNDLLGEAGYKFLLEKFASAESLVNKALESGLVKGSSEEWSEALFLKGLAQCRLGRLEEARQSFTEAHRGGANSAFEALWKRALCVLSESERAVLAQALLGDAERQAALFEQSISRKDYARAYLAATSKDPLLRAELARVVGAYDDAIELAKGSARQRGPKALYVAGRAAFEAGRLKDAVAFWEPLKDKVREWRSIESNYNWAKRVSKGE